MEYEISWSQKVDAPCLADALKEARKRAFERFAKFIINGNPVILNSDLGTVFFTVREKAVLQQLAQGCSNAEIATALGVEVRTIKAYMNKLFTKTNSRNRVELAAKLVAYSMKEDHNELDLIGPIN